MSKNPVDYPKILTITGSPAAIGMAILPFWIMVVPGVQGDYANNWSIGVSAIVTYPMVWLGMVLMTGILLLLMRKKSDATKDKIKKISGLLLYIALAIFVVIMVGVFWLKF